MYNSAIHRTEVRFGSLPAACSAEPGETTLVTPDPPYVALAISTTGASVERDAITAIGAVRFRRDAVIERLALELPPAEDALAALTAFAGDAVIVGHDIGGWRTFLTRHGALLEARWCDTAELAAAVQPAQGPCDLETLCAHLGVQGTGGSDTTPAGNALARAEATHRAFRALATAAAGLDPAVLHAVSRLAQRSGWPLAPVFAAAGDPDSTAGALPHLTAPPPKPLRPGSDEVQLDVDALEALIAPGGPLSESLGSYRDRPGQRRMLRLVADAFNLDDQLMVEAGTGTGKTLAYLVPAAAWALESGRPVVIATHTISLQDQILTKDVPALRNVLSGDLRAAVLKGRSNYLCRTRLEALALRDDLPPGSTATVARLLVWSASTSSGDRSELELSTDEKRIWSHVSAEGEACTAQNCAYAASGDCWLQRARAQAEAAHIIVVNHALLISDMMVANRLLPRHDRLIIDEAHHLEEVATTALGFSASSRTVRTALHSLEHNGAGLLPALAKATAQAALFDQQTNWTPMQDAIAEARQRASVAEDRSTGLFAALGSLASEYSGSGSAQVRLSDAVRHGEAWQRVEEARDSLASALADLREVLVRLSHAVTAAEAFLEGGTGLLSDLSAILRELDDVDTGLAHAISDPSPNDITWVERLSRRVTLHSVPLHVGETLSLHLFSDCETVVLTSATLRAASSFDYLRNRLSLPDAPGEVVESPFDYDEAVLVATPSDMPPPTSPAYQSQVDQTVAALASILGGRVMVLYTSHRGLRETYHHIRAPLGAAGIRVLAQGIDGSRRRLAERFANADRPTVLLGTRSFWEGVDIPGEALACLVMARLPFDVPTDPVFAARGETFEDPFNEFALPRATLRFRQGFGRLIRRETDRGVFVVLDSRVQHRRYGQVFLDALPGGRRWAGPLHELVPCAERFLAGETVGAVPDGVGTADGQFG